MNTCLIHSQMYPQDGYCVYCGVPPTVTLATATHVCFSSSTGNVCDYCGKPVRTTPMGTIDEYPFPKLEKRYHSCFNFGDGFFYFRGVLA